MILICLKLSETVFRFDVSEYAVKRAADEL